MNNIICHKVIDVTKKGITLQSAGEKIYIDFNDCVKNFSLEKGNVCKCVATRDITKLSFTFYTYPKTNIIFKRSFLKDLIAGKSATSKFLDMQKAIVEAGYTSYDLS
jgi:hypothetical protein